MAVTTFIPELWSARLIKHLDNVHVFGNLVNRDYEGEIRNYGDTVHIGNIGPVTIKNYVKNSNIADPDELTMEDQTLVIDQSKYFNFGIDDVDKAQVRAPLMDKAMARAAYALGEETDKFIAKEMAKKISTRKYGTGTASAGTKVKANNAYDILVDLKVLMDKENVPAQGRYIVVPPEFEGLMLKDSRFASAYSSKAEGALTNGLVARAAGFDIHVSNNCPKTSNTYTCIASVKDSTTFAEQIIKTEAYRPQARFGDAIKGLNVYGMKVTNEKEVFGLYADFTE